MTRSDLIAALGIVSPLLLIAALVVAQPNRKPEDRSRGRFAIGVALLAMGAACLILRIVLK